MVSVPSLMISKDLMTIISRFSKGHGSERHSVRSFGGHQHSHCRQPDKCVRGCSGSRCRIRETTSRCTKIIHLHGQLPERQANASSAEPGDAQGRRCAHDPQCGNLLYREGLSVSFCTVDTDINGCLTVVSRFYYADQRKADGAPIGTAISGSAHADFYYELAQRKEQGPWDATFVEGKGYVDFAGK